MDSRNTLDFVEKKRKNKSKKNKLRKKWKICKSAINYGPCLCKVLKKQHPNLNLSVKSINILNSFGNDMLDRIAAEASCLAKYNKHKTINSTEIQSAVRLVLPPGLARGATDCGIRAVVKYCQSKKRVNSRKSLEMNEESNKREIWLKCYSKSKAMVYYWNSETQDSYWEGDRHKVLERPNVEIHDKSEEMKNGEVPTFGPNTKNIGKPENGTTTKSQLPITSTSKAESDESDDDEDFNDIMNAFYESSHSSSSIFNGSQGSITKYEARTGYEKRYSEPLSKSNVSENSADRRKSMENPPIKAPTPVRPVAKPLPNWGKRSLSDTSLSSTWSTSSQRPGLVNKESISQPKLAKTEIQKPPPRGRHKTPIQDRKIKEKEELLRKQKQKEELLLKQKQKTSGSGAHNLPDIIAISSRAPLPVNGDIKMQRVKSFTIPKRKVCNSTPDRESGRGSQSQADSQHSSPRQQSSMPLTRPRVPPVPYRSRQVPPQPMKVAETVTSDSPNNSRPVRRSNDSWIHKVWNTPPAVLAEAEAMPMTAPASVTVPVPGLLAPLVTVPAPGQLAPRVTAPRPPLLPTPPSSEIVQETGTTQFKNPSSNVQHQNFKRTVRVRNSAGETTPTKLNSNRVQETATTQFKDPFPKKHQNFKRTVRVRNSAEEIAATKLDSNRVQETVTTQFKDPSPNVQHQNFRRTVRVRNPVEQTTSTKLDSNRAQETVTDQFKDPSPILTRTMNRNSAEESNKNKLDSGRDSSCTGNGIRKRVDVSDDSDSDDSETANFKRTKTSSETPSESTFATSTPLNRLTLDATGRLSTTVGRQSSVSAGLSSMRSGLTIGTTRPPSALGSAPFDARQILERRRSMQRETVNKPSCSNQDDNAMEWEGVESTPETRNENVKDRVGQPSTSMIMSSLHFKPLIIVCDTNALIHYIDLVEELIDGTLLGIPVTVVVPYQVFRELDGMKEHPDQEVMGGARAAIRLINGITHSGCPAQYNFVLQNCTMHKKKAKHDLELEKNDDFVLNCALQERQACGNDKIVILLTADKHLQIHASMVEIISKCPTTLKGWAREYKEKVRLQALGVNVESPQSRCANSITRQSDHLQPTEVKMDVDPDPFLASKSMFSSPSSCTQTEKSVTLNNCMKFYADSLTDNLLQFLKCVIDKCNEREYGDLKKHASQPGLSWTLVHCLGDVVRRWTTITEKKLSTHMRSNISRIIGLVKKYNQGKEEFTNSDMKTYFTSSQMLAEEFVDLYEDVSGFFLTRLNELLEEWEQKLMSQAVSLCEEDDPQPADMALQNIYNCMRSDYETWKETAEREKNGDRKKELEVCLKAFHTKVTNMLRIIRRPLEDYPQSSLTIGHECIFDFLNETTLFTAEDGHLLTFELTRENILALFKENNLRKGVQAMLYKIRRLHGDVMFLLEELNSSDSDDDLD